MSALAIPNVGRLVEYLREMAKEDPSRPVVLTNSDFHGEGDYVALDEVLADLRE